MWELQCPISEQRKGRKKNKCSTGHVYNPSEGLWETVGGGVVFFCLSVPRREPKLDIDCGCVLESGGCVLEMEGWGRVRAVVEVIR